jgi:hypothetical protein
MREFDAVFVGAGISKSPPTLLPDGDELARIVWEALIGSLPPALQKWTVGASAQLEADRHEQHTVSNDRHDLRLEQLLEVLASAVPLKVLVGVYRILDGAAPNTIHTILGRPELNLGCVLTVNMDTVIDEVAGKRVVHLHGRQDRPGTIMTTISQYLRGLPPELDREFAQAVEGKRILVLGYSGRDRDIAEAFLRHPPSLLHWLQHPGGRLARDAELLMDGLRARGVLVQDVEQSTSEAFLVPRYLGVGGPLDSLPSHSEGGGTGGSWQTPERFRIQLGNAPLAERARAVALVMLEIGQKEEALQLLRGVPAKGEEALKLRKLRARALRSLGRNFEACALLAIPPGRLWDKGTRTMWFGNESQFSATLSAMGLYPLADALDAHLVHRGGEGAEERQVEQALQARVRRAQRMTMRGDFKKATRDFQAVAADAIRTQTLFGLGDYLNAATFHADVLKMQGEYGRAKELMSRVIADLPYANLTQRAYALWRRAEITLVAEVEEVQADGDLDEASRLAALSHDARVQFWTKATEADAWGYRDPKRARRCQREAEDLLGSVHAYGELYLLLIMAEFLRGRNELFGSRELARKAVSLADSRRHFAGVHTSGSLAGRLIVAEADAMEATGTAQVRLVVRDLTQLGDEYSAYGMLSGAARVETALALIQHQGVSPERAAGFVRSGWHREARRALYPDDPSVEQWHVLL